MAGKSFIENVNIIANATALATGDVIEDSNRAKDAAEAAAVEASASADAAGFSKDLSEAWAIKSYNNPVSGSIAEGDAEFSSYHWSVQSGINAAPELIDDDVASATSTWSSNRITAQLLIQAGINHDHNGVYEPSFLKNSAFNKDLFNGVNAGDALSVARGDHVHTDVYEPLINAGNVKGSAFNKDFGTISGSVAQGDHDHDTDYMPLSAIQSGYNKPFVVNTEAPGSEEVPRGTHIHPASKTTHDPEGRTIATSTTVQGAIGQLDGVMSTFEISEKTKILAGLPMGASTVITNPGANTFIIIDGNLTFDIDKNSVYNNNGIEIDYASADAADKPGSPGTKLIEGQFDVTVSLDGLADTEYALVPALFDGTTWTEYPAYRAIGGALTRTAGSISMSLSAWISGLYDKNAIDRAVGNNYKMGIMMSSSGVDNINIRGITMSWAGQGEGALVASGITVDHSELTGLGSGTIHAISDIDQLQIELDTKADKLIPASVGNIATLDATGNLTDSGLAPTDITDKMNLVSAPTLDNILSMTSGGDSKDTGFKIVDLALAGGNSIQAFEVDTATIDTHAITKLQFETEKTITATKQELIDHTAIANPHGTSYSDTGAAAESHIHIVADTTGLQDALNDKYTKALTPATDNIVVFGNGETLIDSGKNLDEIIGTPDATGFAGHMLGTRAENAKDSEWSPFITNPIAITVDYVLQDGVNASIVNPTINDGITVTIPDGSELAIL